jgi:drug/metabolite transporter (DMT)-like permease
LGLFVLFLFSVRYLSEITPKVLKRCALVGAVIAVSHGLSMIGIDKSYATDGVLLYALEPIMAIVFARILLKEKMDALRVAALILALIGFGVLSNITSQRLLANMTFIGNLIMLIGILADGLFSPLAKPVLERASPRIVMMLVIFFAVIFISPFAIMTPVRHAAFSWKAAVSIFYLAVICLGIGWTVWLHYLKKFPVNVIALTVFIQPVVGPFISHYFIGEQIGARVWFGGGIIILAVILATIRRKQTED